MEMLPVNLSEIVGIIFGTSIVLIPIAGITARFALKPIVEAMALMRSRNSSSEETRILEKRVALLERQLEALSAAKMLPISTVNEGRPLPQGSVVPVSER